MEKPLLEYLAHDEIGAAFGDEGTVESASGEGLGVDGLDAFDVFHGQDAGGAELLADGGDVDGWVVGKILGEAELVAAFVGQVGLLGDGFDELLDHLLGVDGLVVEDGGLEDARELFEDLAFGVDDLDDGWSADLDGDLASAGECGAV